MLVENGPRGVFLHLAGTAPDALVHAFATTGTAAADFAVSAPATADWPAPATAGWPAPPPPPIAPGPPSPSNAPLWNPPPAARPAPLRPSVPERSPMLLEDLSLTQARVVDVRRVVLRPDWGPAFSPGSFTLVGRAPEARPEDPQAQLIPVEDPELSVSKTHVALGVDHGGFWLRDLGSTNGTFRLDEHGGATRCAPEEVVRIPVGGRFRLGKRVVVVAE